MIKLRHIYLMRIKLPLFPIKQLLPVNNRFRMMIILKEQKRKRAHNWNSEQKTPNQGYPGV